MPTDPARRGLQPPDHLPALRLTSVLCYTASSSPGFCAPLPRQLSPLGRPQPTPYTWHSKEPPSLKQKPDSPTARASPGTKASATASASIAPAEERRETASAEREQSLASGGSASAPRASFLRVPPDPARSAPCSPHGSAAPNNERRRCEGAVRLCFPHLATTCPPIGFHPQQACPLTAHLCKLLVQPNINPRRRGGAREKNDHSRRGQHMNGAATGGGTTFMNGTLYSLSGHAHIL